MNLKWPKTKEHPERNTWYLIVWRLLMIIPVYSMLLVGTSFIWIAVLFFHGWNEAYRVGSRVKGEWS
jgi:hypothetical protein